MRIYESFYPHYDIKTNDELIKRIFRLEIIKKFVEEKKKNIPIIPGGAPQSRPHPHPHPQHQHQHQSQSQSQSQPQPQTQTQNHEQEAYDKMKQGQQISQLKREYDEIAIENIKLNKRLLMSPSKQTQETFLDIVLDSNYSCSGTNEEHIFKLSPTIYNNITNIQCTSMCIEVLNKFNVTQRNNTLCIILNEVVTTISVEIGYYEISDLVSTLEAKVADELGINDISMEYNEIINRIFIRNTKNNPFKIIQSELVKMLGIHVGTSDCHDAHLYVSTNPPCKMSPLTCNVYMKINTIPVSTIVSENPNINGSSLIINESSIQSVFMNYGDNNPVWNTPIEEIVSVTIKIRNNYETYKKIDTSFQIGLRLFKL
jgi:hypothetical protein